MDDRFKMWLRMGEKHGWFADDIYEDVIRGDRDAAIDLFYDFADFDPSAVFNFVTDIIRDLLDERIEDD